MDIKANEASHFSFLVHFSNAEKLEKPMAAQAFSGGDGNGKSQNLYRLVLHSSKV